MEAAYLSTAPDVRDKSLHNCYNAPHIRLLCLEAGSLLRLNVWNIPKNAVDEAILQAGLGRVLD